MAERHPGWVNNIAAFEARQATGLLVVADGPGDTIGPLRVRSGIRDAGGFPGEVRRNGNKVTVNPFQAVIANPNLPADGPYLVTMDAQKELDLDPPADNVYRTDLVVAEVLDVDPGFRVSVYKGQNSTSPQPPKPEVTNRRSLVLAEVRTFPAGTPSPIPDDTRSFTAALNGLLPVRGEWDRPANPPGSQVIFRLDTKVIEIRRDNAWVPYRPPRVTRIDWQVPTLGGGWVNFGTPFVTPAYAISDDGWVRFRGVIKNGAASATVPLFQLKDGYKPLAQHVFPVATAAAATGLEAKMGRVDVQANGNVFVNSGSTTWLSLDGIAFATL
jgi:hypothetical protein